MTVVKTPDFLPGISQIGLGGWVSEDGGWGERERREEKRA